MNERSVGSLTEERAAKYLTEQGITVLETNYRCPLGEADIVGKDTDGTIVFAEVKFRRSLSYGLPEEAVHTTKQNKLRRTALYYLTEHRLSPETALRFDVVAMDSTEIRWYRDAF